MNQMTMDGGAEVRSTMIEASAGSGKTYQLANRFLALLAAGVEPEHIIALTFTRKAAGEFTERILSRLAAAAGGEESDSLAADIERTWSGDESSDQPAMFSARPGCTVPDQARCLDMLKSVVGSLDRITLSTLDSFFLKVVRQFSFELGLSGFELLDEKELAAARERVLAELFNASRANEKQRASFLGALKLATFGKDAASTSDTLEKFLQEQHDRVVAAPHENQWGNLSLIFPDGMDFPQGVDVHAELAIAREHLPQLVAVGRKGIDNRWLKLFGEFESYQPGHGEILGDKHFSFLMSQLDLLKQGEGDDTYYKKDYTLPPEMARAMYRLVGHVVGTEFKVQAARTVGLWGVLRAYEDAYDGAVRKYGQLGFSDLTHLLANGGLDLGERLEQLRYRLDSRYDHWLLDEFQDTSTSQWDVVDALMGDAVIDADGRRSLFMVGDTKQGIYGWRGGDVRLFGDLMSRDDWAPRRDVWPMSKSWRSSQHVLDLANVVCDPKTASMRGRFPDEAVGRWHYQKHVAAIERSGFAEVVALDPKASPEFSGGRVTAADKDVVTLDAMARRIRDVNPLSRGLSCAVLVRSGKHADTVVDGLRARLGKDYPVELESDVSIGEDSPLGLAITDFFRWLQSPKDSFACAHVWMTPLAPVLDQLGDSPPAVWREANARFMRDGVASLMQMIADSMVTRAGLSGINRDRLSDIHLAAERFDASGGTMGEWVSTLEFLKRREHSRTGTVQVMTIHKSKGLEFDMVLLPYISNSPFDNKGRLSILTQRDGDRQVVNQMMKPAGELCSQNAALDAMLAEWSADQCYEGFCTIYVALTRAARSVHVFVEAVPADDEKRNPRDWVISSVSDGVAKSDLGQEIEHVLYSGGDEGWYEDADGRTDESGRHGVAVGRLGQSVKRRRRRSPSDHAADTDGEGSSEPGKRPLASRMGMRFGNEVHGLFERIRWTDDANDVLAGLDTDAAAAVASTLDSPAVREMFTKRDGVDVFCERPIEAVISGVWVSGVIDRLEVTRTADGSLQSARIIDFKTDKVTSASELVDRYATQLKTYRTMVAAALGADESAVTCALVSTSLKSVVPVTM